jgi:integrase
MPGLRVEWREGIAYAVGTFDGRRIRKSLGTREPAIAAEQCALYEARLFQRRNYGEEAVRVFEEAAESYLRQGGEGRFLAKIIRHFKGRSLAKIKPGDIRDMAISLYPTASNATRNRQAIVPAQAVINHGHDRGWCAPIKVKPFEVRKSKKHKPVDEQWLTKFREQCRKDALPHLGALVLFMNRTAVRVSEALRVMPEDVDLEGRRVFLGKTKTDEDVFCYLTSDVVLAISAMGMEDGKPVFRYSDRSAVNRRIGKVCKRAGLPYRPTHSAGRHSFGTNAISGGADVKKAMDAGRWKSASLFMGTYVHSEDAGRAIAAQFDEKAGLVGTDLPQEKPKQRYRFGKKKV